MPRRFFSFLPVALLAAVAIPAGSLPAAGQVIAPYKDGLFAYREGTAGLAGGRVLDVPYSADIDIGRRDQIPERQVRRDYVDLSPTRRQTDETWHTQAGAVEVALAGVRHDPAFVVLFIHGKGGDRRLGMNDWTFGGNFNRLKNIAQRSGGLYMTMSAGLFAEADQKRASGLVAEIASRYPSARIVVACGSMGGRLCWSIAEGRQASLVSGLVLLGGQSSTGDVRAAMKARGGRPLPTLIAHGSADKVYDFALQRHVADEVAAAFPGYPIRFVGFETGSHGTPIRMIDWRDTLNWILGR
ncbi:hypothetical protein NDN16_11435 [Aureimonas altamirensis]|uniref:hypothetical protein n=1 Tax=Aureimonas altamirensis TaxID=370622 RepID=UPI00203678A0|nr:hypothetical protein [Aureimonas altamirensis]MCM2504284.1 hypothetical protein [Aureimonas altamirensis]